MNSLKYSLKILSLISVFFMLTGYRGAVVRLRLASIALALFVAGTGLSGCGRAPEPVEMAMLVQSLNLDPSIDLDVDCPTLPPETRRVLFAGVFVNQSPIRPDSPEFPSDFCPPNTRFYARAEGRGNSSVFGEFTWSEHYCALPMAEIVAEGHFEGKSGDRLNWDARIRSDSIPPPIPFATFSGGFTFTGGTGPFTGVSGEAVVVAKQLGDAPPGRPAGSTAAAVCGWVEGGMQ